MAFAIATDTAGNVVLGGRFADWVTLAGATPVPAGDLDAAIAKFNPDGQLVWVRRPGGNGRDSAQGIAIDTEGNAIVTGFFRGTGTFGESIVDSAGHRDVFVAKYDQIGTLVWVQRAGGPFIDEGRDVATDNSGNIFVTGGFEGQAAFAENLTITAEKGSHAFVVKYDTAGTPLWIRQAGGDGRTWGNAIATDSAGNVLIAGAFTRIAKFSGTKLKSAGNLDIFIAKYDPGGNLLWAKTVGGRGRDIAYSVTTDAANNVLVAGRFSRVADFDEDQLKSVGDNDAFVAKYTPDGTLAWVVPFGGNGNDAAHGVTTDDDDNVLLTGSFRGQMSIGNMTLTSAGRRDIFVAAFNPGGTLLSAQAAGGPGSDSGFAIVADGRGGAYVTGSLSATAAFGESILRSTGSDDLFITRMSYGKP
ncbi:MAG: SBBP repeat-containing protein [Alphaproteobacteria bacterium]